MSATLPGTAQAQTAMQVNQALTILSAGQSGSAETALSRVLLARPLEP